MMFYRMPYKTNIEKQQNISHLEQNDNSAQIYLNKAPKVKQKEDIIYKH